MNPTPPSRAIRLIAGSAALAMAAVMLLATASIIPPAAPQPIPTSSPPAAAPAEPPRWPPIDWWDWGINRVLTSSERGLMAGTGCDTLFALAGAIYQVGREPLWTPQGRPGAPASGVNTHLVVRIDSELGRALDAASTATLVPILVAGFLRNRTPETTGLQLDCDVPTKRLITYADFLHHLRAQLPPGIQLSVTMLLDWTHSKDLQTLAREVDFVVPQCYSALAPFASSDTAVTLASNIQGTLQRLERARVSYRLGLPTFEQCSLFGARGELVRATMPVSPEAAISVGGLVSRISHGDETTIEMSFPAATQLAGTTIAAGAHLLFGGLSATGLEHTLEALRNRMPAHCLGVCLFHLPGTEATSSLTISQVAAAANGMVRPATVSARLLPQGGGRWTVVLSNRGDEDWFDVASPAHIAIHASHGGIHLGAHVPHPGLIRAQVTSETPSGSASPVSACAIDVGVLRAGDVVTIEDLSVDPGCTPIGTIWCRGRSSEVDTAIR